MDGLAQHIEALQALKSRQADKHAGSVRRSQDKDAALEHTQRLAQAATRELFEFEAGADDLKSLQPALAQRRKEAEVRLEHAQRRHRIANEALQKPMPRSSTCNCGACRGSRSFAGSPAIAALRDALRDWVQTIDPARHGAEAVEPAGALTMAIKALADTSGGDAKAALHTLKTLRGHTWGTLLPAPAAGPGHPRRWTRPAKAWWICWPTCRVAPRCWAICWHRRPKACPTTPAATPPAWRCRPKRRCARPHTGTA